MISLVDWIIANMLAVRQGSLGHIRYVLKNDLKWLPLYGFYFQQVKQRETEIKNSREFVSAWLYLRSSK